jgi:uncharacterized protein YeaO (DUF488 family)
MGSMSNRVRLRRAYEPPEDGDGYRVLVDRIWPRGAKREALNLDAWEKDLAPSDELRRWYAHQVERWPEFRRRYREELSTDEARSELESLARHAKSDVLTLVFGARDAEHSQAAVLRDVIEERLASSEG